MFGRKKLTTLFLASVIVAGGLFYAGSAKAACTFSGTGAWGKDPAVIALGESIAFTAPGDQECANKTVDVSFYGRSGFDFLIKTLKINANSGGNVAGTVSFSASDFAGRSGDQRVYYKARTEDGSSNELTSQNLTVRLVSQGSCTLTTAQWRWNFSDQPILGSPVEMIVNGSGCENARIRIDIKEDDLTVNDLIHTIFSSFDSTGTRVVTPWTVSKQGSAGSAGDQSGSYDFFFEVSLVSVPQAMVVSGNLNAPSGIPVNSETGCVNCNAGFQPNTCQCADGYSQERELIQDCRNVCADHIGDAQGGTGDGPGDGVCNNNGVCEPERGETAALCPAENCVVAPGATQSFEFRLDNPIEADNFLELIDVIATWLFNLSIPIVVAMIVYSGVMFLISRGDSAKLIQAKQILLYAVVGFAIILIGKGFITLIESILNLGAGS